MSGQSCSNFNDKNINYLYSIHNQINHDAYLIIAINSVKVMDEHMSIFHFSSPIFNCMYGARNDSTRFDTFERLFVNFELATNLIHCRSHTLK